MTRPRHAAGDGPLSKSGMSRKLLVVAVLAVVAAFVVTTIAVVRLLPTMLAATQAANDFFDEAREGRPIEELLCAPLRQPTGSTSGPREWTPPEEWLRPGPSDAVGESVGQNLSQVWVSGVIGGGVDTATVSGRLDLAESTGGQATPVSVRLRLDDERWCVRDVWLELSHREAIRRR
jgi:hypothetical protein